MDMVTSCIISFGLASFAGFMMLETLHSFWTVTFYVLCAAGLAFAALA